MARPIWVLLALAGLSAGCVIVVPGGTGGGGGQAPKVYCVKDKASGACYCATSDPGLNGDTDYVSDCDTLPADTQCCHDINGDGETTDCSCYRGVCATDTDTDQCRCEYFGTLLIGKNRDNEVIVATCPTTSCCKGSESCSCGLGGTCFGSDVAVSSCATSSIPAKRVCAGGDRWAASCAGLKWKK